MPDQQLDFQNPAHPPPMTMDYDFSNSSSSHASATISNAAPLFQFGPSGDLRNQGYKDEIPSYSVPSRPPLGKASQQPHEPMPAIVNYTLYEVGSDLLSPFPEPSAPVGRPMLKPKPTLSSLGVIADRDTNTAIFMGSKKPGRRNGPLNAEGRKSASQMRRNGACLTCKFRKTRVG